MSPIARILLVAGAIAFGALVAGFSRVAFDARERAGRRAALSLIPPGPAFVLTLDVAKLRHTEVSTILKPGLSRLGIFASGCDFEPIREIDELALSVESAEAPLAGAAASDEIGIVATGSFAKSAVLSCAERTISARGGEPVRTEIARFSSVRDRTRGGGEIAVRDGGLLIVSGGRYFRELLDRADGRAASGPASARDALHVELRQRLGLDAPLLVSWVLPDDWTKHFVGDHEAKLSPLAEVRALGLKATFDRAPALEALLGCASEAGCRSVAGFLEELRSTFGPDLELDPTLRLARRVRIEQKSSEIRLRLTLGRAELKTLIDRMLRASPPKLP